MSKLYQHDENAEIAYLKQLIDTFGIQSNLKVEDIIRTIYARFHELDKNRGKILRTVTQNMDGYHQLCTTIHAYLYQDIIYNSGQFRNSNDPNGGNVYFGGGNPRTMQTKFVGTNPDFIEIELSQAFAILLDKKYIHQENALRFYAEFVAIHPFYDANGRIGRYIVDIYLQQHKYYVDWQSINRSHSKFLRKLNYCHSVRAKYKQYLLQRDLSSVSYSSRNVYWESVREKYIGYLLSFWCQFVESIDNLEI